MRRSLNVLLAVILLAACAGCFVAVEPDGRRHDGVGDGYRHDDRRDHDGRGPYDRR